MAVKAKEQQALLAMHRVRDLIVRQKTQILNVIRRLLRVFGHVVGRGPVAALRFVKACQAGDCPDIPDLVTSVLKMLCDQVVALDDRVVFYDKLIRTVPGVGPIPALAIAATVGDGKNASRDQRPDTGLY